MGLFDGLNAGLKDAFGADGASSSLPADRETPIDRWLGVDVSNKNDEVLAAAAAEGGAAAAAEFIDSMDEANYVSLELVKPMGVVFEENEPATGGVFVASFAEGGAAEADGTLQKGDQLVVVADTQVLGRDFDTCLDVIRESEAPTTRLVVFRGSSKFLYGNLGPSTEWLQGYMSKLGVAAAAAAE